MQRRDFLGALSALVVVAQLPEAQATIAAAAQDLDPNEDLTLDEHIRKLQEWADELERQGVLQRPTKITQEDLDKLNAMMRKRHAAIDEFTPCDIKTLMVAAEAGKNAGYCPMPNPGTETWPAISRANIDGIKRILVEGKVAVDRHGFVVTDAVASKQDKWKLSPIRHAVNGKLSKGDRNHDWLWGMRISYLDVVPPGVMIMWSELEVEYEPLKVKDPNAVVIIYL